MVPAASTTLGGKGETTDRVEMKKLIRMDMDGWLWSLIRIGPTNVNELIDVSMADSE